MGVSNARKATAKWEERRRGISYRLRTPAWTVSFWKQANSTWRIKYLNKIEDENFDLLMPYNSMKEVTPSDCYHYILGVLRGKRTLDSNGYAIWPLLKEVGAPK